MKAGRTVISFAVAVTVGLLSPSASAQQRLGVGPMQGGPRLDDRGRGLRQPPPQERGPVARLMVGCTFYEHAAFEGRSTAYRQLPGVQPGDYTRDVSYVGDTMNDRFSSFKCDNPCHATIYTDANFQGDVALNYNQSPDMTNVSGPTRSGFNDVVSSLKVVCRTF